MRWFQIPPKTTGLEIFIKRNVHHHGCHFCGFHQFNLAQSFLMQLHHPTILICVYYKHQMKEEVIMKKLGG